MKAPIKSIVLGALLACTLFGAISSLRAQAGRGDWTIRKSEQPGKIIFTLIISDRHNRSNHEVEEPLGDFHGVDLSKPGKQNVEFTLARDAGKFECEGFLHDGEGAGVFHFSANANYPQAMRALGFEGIDSEKQLEMATIDVSLEFAKEMKAERLEGLDTDKLIASGFLA